MITVTIVKKSAYHDSVALLALARDLRSAAGVREASALMATDANKAYMAQSGLLTPEAVAAGPNDLVIVIQAAAPGDAEHARSLADELLVARRQRAATGRARPRTLDSARRHLPGANLALISVPGAFAAAEARKALRQGLHAMLFSDNVPLDEEIGLKRLAASKGLLLMGPDCGTAYLNGIPLGFANAVPRGRIGIVAASGTGLQQVATLLAARGAGISHAIGVGGRDMSDAVGGLMTLEALAALGADPATELILVIGKPPAPAVRERVTARLHEIGKPAVVAMLGRDIAPGRREGVTTVTTLEDAALGALAALNGEPLAPTPSGLPREAVEARILAARSELGPGQRAIRGFYAGGTLAYEALLILEPLAGPVRTNLEPGSEGVHQILDLGADEFTVGRAHPMLDSTSRIEAIERAGKEPSVGVLLLDVMLGYGAAHDPAGDIAPAVRAARAEARAHGRGLAAVATVVGTPDDPQGLAGQIGRLEAAGVWVLPSNAQAARAAASIVGDGAVTDGPRAPVSR
ncbi:MAG TPA: acyl-CoA synthetase FdrA [Gemmatimonadales bacterium]|nr:acyl-CoA synthetase FdrA [Gemmatimonadales bacterium]